MSQGSVHSACPKGIVLLSTEPVMAGVNWTPSLGCNAAPPIHRSQLAVTILLPGTVLCTGVTPHMLALMKLSMIPRRWSRASRSSSYSGRLLTAGSACAGMPRDTASCTKRFLSPQARRRALAA